MKKFLSFLALTLILCLACVGVVALAEGDATEPAEPAQTAAAHEHVFNVVDTPKAGDKVKFISMPSESKDTGLLRFICENAGDYTTGLDQTEFLDYVVYPTSHELYLPKEDDYDAVKALINTARMVPGSYIPPTCTEPGSVKIKCAHVEQDPKRDVGEYGDECYYGWEGTCSFEKTYSIPATGHKWGSKQEPAVYQNIQPATCTEKGLVQDYCLNENCGAVGDVIETDKIGHVPADEWVEEKATCVEPGRKVQICKYCGEELQVEEIPVNEKAHVFGDWVIDENGYKKATCTEDGLLVEYRLCSVCLTAKEVRSTVLKATGHDKENKIPDPNGYKAPTCKEDGYQKYICPLCKEVIEEEGWTEILKADPTNPDLHPKENVYLKETVNPTCTKDGREIYECSLCETQVYEKPLTKLGHLVDKKCPVKLDGKCAEDDADALEDLYVTFCMRENCSDDQNLTVPAGYTVPDEYANAKVIKIDKGDVPSHDWTAWKQRNPYVEGSTAAYWIRQCRVCGKHDELIVNNAGDPEKTNPVCLKKGHTPGTPVEENVVPATIDSEGSYDKVIYCTVCGDPITTEHVTTPKIKDGLTKDDDKVWRLYNNGEVSTETKIVTYDGAEFWVVNGVVPGDATGLVICPDGTPYFMNEGQILRDANDIVMYDDHWFIVSNGVLDKNASGLYDYDGGKFVFAAGQLKTDVSGLWQNPQDGKWYFLANGQVQDHTGVVEYRGRFFVVENGVLNTSYNETIEYDGHTFEVADGQLAVNYID